MKTITLFAICIMISLSAFAQADYGTKGSQKDVHATTIIRTTFTATVSISKDGTVIIITDDDIDNIAINGHGMVQSGQIKDGDRVLVEGTELVMKKCGTCGTKVFRILGKA